MPPSPPAQAWGRGGLAPVAALPRAGRYPGRAAAQRRVLRAQGCRRGHATATGRQADFVPGCIVFDGVEVKKSLAEFRCKSSEKDVQNHFSQAKSRCEKYLCLDFTSYSILSRIHRLSFEFGFPTITLLPC